MADFLGGENKHGGVNFIQSGLDRTTDILRKLMVWGVVTVALVVVSLIGVSFYQASLDKELSGVKAQMNIAAASLKATSEFENEFLAVQDKLLVYSDINDDEKMMDLFPKLSALIPDDVRLQDLIIYPDSVELICIGNDVLSVARFKANLEILGSGEGIEFEDGQRMILGNVEFKDVTKSDTKSESNAAAGFNQVVTFNYSIK
jgi:Tfp pilus assembly protein PilN